MSEGWSHGWPDGGAPIPALLQNFRSAALWRRRAKRSSMVSRGWASGRGVELDDACIAAADTALDFEQIGDGHGHDGEAAVSAATMIQRVNRLEGAG